jgi:hypothetical protein
VLQKKYSCPPQGKGISNTIGNETGVWQGERAQVLLFSIDIWHTRESKTFKVGKIVEGLHPLDNTETKPSTWSSLKDLSSETRI